jgi:hypothetical protein
LEQGVSEDDDSSSVSSDERERNSKITSHKHSKSLKLYDLRGDGIREHSFKENDEAKLSSAKTHKEIRMKKQRKSSKIKP